MVGSSSRGLRHFMDSISLLIWIFLVGISPGQMIIQDWCASKKDLIEVLPTLLGTLVFLMLL